MKIFSNSKRLAFSQRKQNNFLEEVSHIAYFSSRRAHPYPQKKYTMEVNKSRIAEIRKLNIIYSGLLFKMSHQKLVYDFRVLHLIG